ncbi:MAG: carboxypeptidase-like regulatory domain-containing protein [Bacteroidetes bacterium]|nr:carboxypeptidase-like regulatory domain-containing protein [Bacteroidota bacterium]MBU1580562.1 carboxypeptidase-like regulatory domain-containing protein [Bacteroidota bacterium]MBU2466659.1 carboxypeptidase-like regulatory domain-containing protein [Bacteroidota bacterium]MBU2558661.1 carboxypeptidase-like regulatory domain-containing protein [Bacteroidota bacterium]
MKWLSLIFLLLFSGMLGRSVQAQEIRKVHGRILSADSLLPVSNVHIISKFAKRGTISNKQGFFAYRGYDTDTILLSSIGYERKVMGISDTLLDQPGGLYILLEKDTVQMNEVVVRAFYDWPTFKYLFVHMEPVKAFEIEDFSLELENSLVGVQPAPLTIKGPIQALYDLFNHMARLQRRLERNRKAYNEQLIREGRVQDTIPEIPEHRQK